MDVRPNAAAAGHQRPASGNLPKAAFAWLAKAQVALIVLTPLLVLLPQQDGAMLIAPLASDDRNATIRWALRAGAKPVAPGPIGGSYVVQGSFATLFAPGLLHGALIIDARFAGCGTPNPRTI